MIVIAVVDDANGLLFCNRRQSRDRILCQRILEETAGQRLWMNAYSAALFAGFCAKQITVEEAFLEKAEDGDFCFLEEALPTEVLERVERIVLFRWNRSYPGDVFFDVEVTRAPWRLASSEEFAGSSHERITMEVYER